MNFRYQKHKELHELKNIPEYIFAQYDFERGQYLSCEIKGYEQSFPILIYEWEKIESKGIDIEKLPLEEYAKGFLEGYHTDLIPKVLSRTFDVRSPKTLLTLLSRVAMASFSTVEPK